MDKSRHSQKLAVPAKAGIAYIITGVLSRGISFIGTPIFSRLLAPAEFGLFPLFTTWFSIISAFVTLELSGSVIYRGLQKYEKEKSDFITSAFGLFLTVFIPFVLIYYIFSGGINSLSGLSTELFTLIFITIFFNTVISFYLSYAKYLYNYKSCAKITLLNSILAPTLSVLLAVVMNYDGKSRIFGTTIASGIVAFPLIFRLIRNKSHLFNREMWKFLLKFNLPLLPHYISLALILRIGEAVVGKTFGNTALAKYSVAMSLGLSLTMISNGAMSALSPWIMRKMKEKAFGKVRKTVTLTVKLLSLATLFLLSISPELLKLVAPAKYSDILICVFPLALCIVPMYISNVIMSSELYFEKNFTATLPSVATAILSIILSLWLLPKFDYRAVAFYALISYVTLMLLNVLSFKKITTKYPFSLLEITFSFIFLFIFATIFYLLRFEFLSRIIIVLLLLPVFIALAIQFFSQIKEKKYIENYRKM